MKTTSISIRRFLAFYIDFFFTAFLSLLLYFIFSSLYINIPYIEYGYSYIYLIFFIYIFICEFLFKKTIGKKICGLKVVFSGTKYFGCFILLRTISRLIPFEPFSVFMNTNQIMWHDRFSKTQVVLNKNGSPQLARASRS